MGWYFPSLNLLKKGSKKLLFQINDRLSSKLVLTNEQLTREWLTLQNFSSFPSPFFVLSFSQNIFVKHLLYGSEFVLKSNDLMVNADPCHFGVYCALQNIDKTNSNAVW